MPDSSDWHRRLLSQMSAEIPTLRSPVITRETRILLEPYCAFHHVVRNIYPFNLRLDRLQPLAEVLPQSYDQFRWDCEAFCGFLAEF